MSVGYASGLEEDEIIDIAIANGGGVYGEDYTTSFTAEQGRTANGYQTVGTLVVPPHFNANKYILDVTYLWGFNSPSYDIQTRLLRNGNDQSNAFKQRAEPKDSAGSGEGGTDQRQPVIVRDEFSGLEENQPSTFQFQAQSSLNGIDWVMAYVRMVWIRVA